MMRTAVTEMFGIDLPIFALSHCRDVVVEASRAGGMGVLGAAWMTPDELEASLKWIDRHVEGKPYGVDVVFPGTFAALEDDRDPEQILPREYRDFVGGLIDQVNIPTLPAAGATEFAREHATKMKMTPRDSERSLEIELERAVELRLGKNMRKPGERSRWPDAVRGFHAPVPADAADNEDEPEGRSSSAGRCRTAATDHRQRRR